MKVVTMMMTLDHLSTEMSGYNAFVANSVTNYRSQSGKDLAFRYLIPKADLETAMLDHDYTKLPFAEYSIDRANKVIIRQQKT